jgi:hypothetical protein
MKLRTLQTDQNLHTLDFNVLCCLYGSGRGARLWAVAHFAPPPPGRPRAGRKFVIYYLSYLLIYLNWFFFCCFVGSGWGGLLWAVSPFPPPPPPSLPLPVLNLDITQFS